MKLEQLKAIINEEVKRAIHERKVVRAEVRQAIAEALPKLGSGQRFKNLVKKIKAKSKNEAVVKEDAAPRGLVGKKIKLISPVEDAGGKTVPAGTVGTVYDQMWPNEIEATFSGYGAKRTTWTVKKGEYKVIKEAKERKCPDCGKRLGPNQIKCSSCARKTLGEADDPKLGIHKYSCCGSPKERGHTKDCPVMTELRQKVHEVIREELEEALNEGPVRNPAAVAAAIGRKKYGKKKFQAMAAAGRRKKA